MELDERRQVHVGHHVPGDDEEAVVKFVDRVEHRSGGPERCLLGRVDETNPELRPVPEIGANRAREKADRHDDLLETVAPEQVHDVLAIGALAIGSIGLGWLAVSGRSLVPSPPAMITAFTEPPPHVARALAGARRAPGGRTGHSGGGGEAQDQAGTTATQVMSVST